MTDTLLRWLKKLKKKNQSIGFTKTNRQTECLPLSAAFAASQTHRLGRLGDRTRSEVQEAHTVGQLPSWPPINVPDGLMPQAHWSLLHLETTFRAPTVSHLWGAKSFTTLTRI